MGSIELEYEGTETFLKEEVPALFSALIDLYQSAPIKDQGIESAPPQSDGEGRQSRVQATTGSLAAKLNVKSGSELILAAAARLYFVEGLMAFPRQRLIDEMKTASAYYKSTYLNNLSQYLQRLVKEGHLNEPSQGNFALTASSIESMKARIV